MNHGYNHPWEGVYEDMPEAAHAPAVAPRAPSVTVKDANQLFDQIMRARQMPNPVEMKRSAKPTAPVAAASVTPAAGSAPRDFLAEAEAELAHLDEYRGVHVPEAEKALWLRCVVRVIMLVGLVWKHVVRPVVSTALLCIGWLGCFAVVPPMIAMVLGGPLERLMRSVGIDDDGTDCDLMRATGLVTLAFVGVALLLEGEHPPVRSGRVAVEVAPTPAPTQPVQKAPTEVAALVMATPPTPVPAKTYPWRDVERAVLDDHQKPWYAGKGCSAWTAGYVNGAGTFKLERDLDGVTLLFADVVYRVTAVHADETSAILDLYSFSVEHQGNGARGRMYASRAACLLAAQKLAAIEKQDAERTATEVQDARATVVAIEAKQQRKRAIRKTSKTAWWLDRPGVTRDLEAERACSRDPDCVQ